jgi:hypothetical protein
MQNQGILHLESSPISRVRVGLPILLFPNRNTPSPARAWGYSLGCAFSSRTSVHVVLWSMVQARFTYASP